MRMRWLLLLTGSPTASTLSPRHAPSCHGCEAKALLLWVQSMVPDAELSSLTLIVMVQPITS